MAAVRILHGDALDVLAALPDCSVDAVVTDPPYALGFMGQAWDTHTPGGFQHWCELWARECLRVLKPGGHLAAFGGTRTYHRLVAGIEDAGFEVRDSLHWLYASGFPKSADVSKAIDKAAGATREVVGRKGGRYASGFTPRSFAANAPGGNYRWGDQHYQWDDLPPQARTYFEGAMERKGEITAPATADARRWQGWGTALKPAHEPIVLARKPLAGTVAGNVQAWGTGALNIDATRVAMSQDDADFIRKTARPNTAGHEHVGGVMNRPVAPTVNVHPSGRWPANVVLSHVPLLDESGDPVGDACADGCVPGCQVAALDAQSGRTVSRVGKPRGAAGGHGWRMTATGTEYADEGGASRFFPTFRYQAKAPARERPNVDGVRHPTVKPLALMEWLVRLVTPPGGTVLDPFAGSGTTAEAALSEGFACVAIEREAEYLPLIEARLARQRNATRTIAASSLFDAETA